MTRARAWDGQAGGTWMVRGGGGGGETKLLNNISHCIFGSLTWVAIHSFEINLGVRLAVDMFVIEAPWNAGSFIWAVTTGVFIHTFRAAWNSFPDKTVRFTWNSGRTFHRICIVETPWNALSFCFAPFTSSDEKTIHVMIVCNKIILKTFLYTFNRSRES